MNHYKRILSSEVETSRRVLALQVLRMCCDHLRVDPDYEWIVPCREEEATLSRKNDIGGLYVASEHVLYLRAGSPNLLHHVAHEVRHAWQMTNWGRPTKAYTPVVEADADRYADEALRVLQFGETSTWKALGKPESFPLKEIFERDPEQVQDFVLTRLSHMNKLFS